MKNLDKIGFISSLICAIHCSIMPLLILVLPIFSLSMIVNEMFEWIFLAFSLLIGLFNLCFGYKKHKSYKALIVLTIGLILIVIGRCMHYHVQNQHGFHFDFYNLMLIFGGVLVAISHKINNFLCKTCYKCNH